MSTKVAQKVPELLTVLSSLVIICIGIILYGIATRPPTRLIYIYAEKQCSGFESSRSAFIDGATEFAMTNLTQAEQTVLELQEELAVPELEGAALYDSYIYEITSTLYPDVDPELVRAIVHRESRYIPTKVNSKTGVMGLAQISPKWHTKRAQSLGVDDLLDPYGNILVCCDLLHELYQSYSKDYALNVYAGGYPYANQYRKSTSPYVKSINKIVQGLQDGSIIPGEG